MTHNTASFGGFVPLDAKVDSVPGADGTTLTHAQLLAMPVNVNGSAGVARTLTGTSDDNVFDGHGGNDVENGAGNNDAYLLQSGYNGITINNDPKRRESTQSQSKLTVLLSRLLCVNVSPTRSRPTYATTSLRSAIGPSQDV